MGIIGYDVDKLTRAFASAFELWNSGLSLGGQSEGQGDLVSRLMRGITRVTTLNPKPF